MITGANPRHLCHLRAAACIGVGACSLLGAFVLWEILTHFSVAKQTCFQCNKSTTGEKRKEVLLVRKTKETFALCRFWASPRLGHAGHGKKERVKKPELNGKTSRGNIEYSTSRSNGYKKGNK